MASILVVAFSSLGLCAGMAFLVDTLADRLLRVRETDDLLASDLLVAQTAPRV